MNCYKPSLPVLKALCDETRLGILELLSSGQKNGCEIHRAFCCTQPTISYHMKVLVDSGLVQSHKEGCAVIYSLNQSLWPSVQQCLEKLCADSTHQEAHHE